MVERVVYPKQAEAVLALALRPDQKQLALGRYDGVVLLLDEATAALDTLAEQKVLGALARLREGRTTFVIAHRLSSVRDADRILVLDAGRIVAEGHHRELLESSELYRQLCAQFVDEPASAAVRRAEL